MNLFEFYSCTTSSSNYTSRTSRSERRPMKEEHRFSAESFRLRPRMAYKLAAEGKKVIITHERYEDMEFQIVMIDTRPEEHKRYDKF